MARTQTRYVCQQCGYESLKWLGRCPDCNQWNSLVEEVVTRVARESQGESVPLYNPARPIHEISVGEHHRRNTGIGEFDRVLGGGIVPGSVVLIGGDPGIGKSTILTQVASRLADQETVLYVSGEESVEQIKMRAERLGALSEQLYLLTEVDLEQIKAQIETLKPGLVIIDSIQAMYDPSLESAPATVSQVRSCAGALVRVAKSTDIPIFIIGHVTKDGSIAGPRVLEHMVDTVLYFEGDRHHRYRILRAVKNRFGSTDELGIFEMREDGLAEVNNPSEILLSERARNDPGSAVTAIIEGTRALLVEVQALVAPSYFAAPRRMVTGVDYNRAMLTLAVLEKRVGLRLSNQDVYINVAGGVRAFEPAADLAIAVAVASSLRDLPVDTQTVVLGEVGLAGEVRAVSQLEKRIREAERLGFQKTIVPWGSRLVSDMGSIKSNAVRTVYKAIECALGARADDGWCGSQDTSLT